MNSQTPHSETPRNLSGLDLGLLWFGAAISITEIWGGGLPGITGVGLLFGIVAILIGRLIGNGMMAAIAAQGAASGLPTMMLTRAAFGIRGSYLPSFFNILQLVGWTGWMLFVGALYMDILAGYLGLPKMADVPAMRFLWVGLLGVLCTVWAFGGQRFWKSVQYVSSILLFILTLLLTYVVLTTYDLTGLYAPAAPLRVLGAADVVIAMSVSWLPLVADYSRLARSTRGASLGTFWGYFIGGTWMYAVGLLVALATKTSTPDQMVVDVMGTQGLAWAIAAAALVLLSTVTTTFLDIYSAVVSTENLFPSVPLRLGSIATGAIGIAIALFLDVFAYEPFLLAIGAVFLPIFSIVLADLYLLRRGQLSVEAIAQRTGPYWFNGGFNIAALGAWFVGFMVYEWARGFKGLITITSLFGINPPVQQWEIGASLPCIVASVAAYLLFSMNRLRRSTG